MPVTGLNIALAVLTAVTVVVSMRVVGLLLISALMIIPNATAQLLGRSFRASIRWAVLVGVVSSVGGVIVSFYAETPSGGTIVLLAIGAFVVAALGTGAVARATGHTSTGGPSGTTTSTGPTAATRPIAHGDHVDYVHDGHRHAAHEGHYDEHGAEARPEHRPRRATAPGGAALMTDPGPPPPTEDAAPPGSGRPSLPCSPTSASSAPPRSCTRCCATPATGRPRHRLPQPAGDGRRRRDRHAAHRRGRGGLPRLLDRPPPPPRVPRRAAGPSRSRARPSRRGPTRSARSTGSPTCATPSRSSAPARAAPADPAAASRARARQRPRALGRGQVDRAAVAAVALGVGLDRLPTGGAGRSRATGVSWKTISA